MIAESVAPCAGRRHRGLTLVEVTIAATLLATAICAFLEGFRLGQAAARRARAQVVVEGLTRGLVARVEQAGFEKAASEKGSFAPDFPDVTYELQVRNTALKTLKSVAITVRWLEGTGERTLACETLLGDRRAKKKAKGPGP